SVPSVMWRRIGLTTAHRLDRALMAELRNEQVVVVMKVASVIRLVATAVGDGRRERNGMEDRAAVAEVEK
ncbi:hypothetical protein SOVF_050690, partial [Spinacia oleracea]